MPARDLRGRHPRLLPLEHTDNLRLGETALSHVSAPSKVGQTPHQAEGVSEGQVTGRPSFFRLSDPLYWRPQNSLSWGGPGPRAVQFGRSSASLQIEPIAAAKQER